MLSLPTLFPNLGGRTSAENTVNGVLKREEGEREGGVAPSVLFKLVLLSGYIQKQLLTQSATVLSGLLFQGPNCCSYVKAASVCCCAVLAVGSSSRWRPRPPTCSPDPGSAGPCAECRTLCWCRSDRGGAGRWAWWPGRDERSCRRCQTNPKRSVLHLLP